MKLRKVILVTEISLEEVHFIWILKDMSSVMAAVSKVKWSLGRGMDRKSKVLIGRCD